MHSVTFQSPDRRGGSSSDVNSQEMKKMKEQLHQYKKQQQVHTYTHSTHTEDDK